MKLLLLATVPGELLTLKSEFIKTALKKNYQVIASSSALHSESSIDIANLKFTYDPIYLKRHGFSVIGNFKTILSIINLYKKHNPQYILASGIKLVIWGGISSRIVNAPFYAHITGLGYAFQDVTFLRRLLKKVVSILYKVALKNSQAVIFENIDNRDLFVSQGIIPMSKSFIINGSGVDLQKYSFTKIPDTDISFLMISRLLGEKGIREYAAAAKLVKQKFPDVQFQLVGSQDASLDAIPLEEVLSWSEYINYEGFVKDIRSSIKNCHVFVLPSYHEGLPRCTIEAMSMGRPILTTNAVGCKETVEEDINGFMVSIGSSSELAKKMIWFIENPNKISSMGKNSRAIAEQRFDIHKINSEIFKILNI